MGQATATRPGPLARADRVSRAAICAVLLVGPTAIAFLTGGVRGDARAGMAVVAWGSVALAALAWRRPPLPRDGPGWLAVGGLGGLAALTALSAEWAPLRGAAFEDGVRVAGYVAVLALAATAWPSRRALRLIEPGLAAGTAIVIGYGLSGRLLPGLVELDRSFGAGDLLEQPITYWNAMGAVAAVGLVLCARLAGDGERRAALAAAAAGVAPLLGAGLYLTGSVGAALAGAVGLAVLWALAPRRRQLVAAAVVLVAAALGALAIGAMPAVRTPGDDPSQGQGLVSLVLLLALAVAAATAQRRLVAPDGDRAVAGGGRLRGLAVGAAVALVAATVAAGALGGGSGDADATGVAGENRPEYWSVAVGTFAEHPLRGAGTGAFAVEWARERTVAESVRDAHSLYVETAAELGAAGLALLAALVAGVGIAGRRAHRRDPGAVAGLGAGLAVLAAHAAVDWDWEVPAVALIALVLAGGILASASATPPD